MGSYRTSRHPAWHVLIGAMVALIAGQAIAADAGKLTTQQQLARDIYQELVEINTSQSVGDTYKAAQAMAARLKAAGFPDADVQTFQTAPKRGNLVARLRGLVGVAHGLRGVDLHQLLVDVPRHLLLRCELAGIDGSGSTCNQRDRCTDQYGPRPGAIRSIATHGFLPQDEAESVPERGAPAQAIRYMRLGATLSQRRQTRRNWWAELKPDISATRSSGSSLCVSSSRASPTRKRCT